MAIAPFENAQRPTCCSRSARKARFSSKGSIAPGADGCGGSGDRIEAQELAKSGGLYIFSFVSRDFPFFLRDFKSFFRGKKR